MTVTKVSGSRTKLPAYCKWLGLYYLLVAVLMVLPTFLGALHIQWLPSPAFAYQMRWLAIIVGLATALSCFLMFLRLGSIRKADKEKQAMSAVLLLCLILAVCGYYSTITTAPVAAAIVAGRDIDRVFVVKDVKPYRIKYCGYAIELEYLSPHYGTLCGVAPEFIKQLHPGSEIVVSGRGTSWGLFVRSARLADTNQAGTS